MISKFAVGFLILGFFVAQPALALTTNGSFENGASISGDFNILYTGDSTSITGWTVKSGEVDIVKDTLWQAAEGNRSIDLNGGQPGSIATTINTEVGATYIVYFNLSGNPQWGSDTTYEKKMQVSVNGDSKKKFEYDISINGNSFEDMNWENHQYTFVANSTSSEIVFASLSKKNDAFGAVIDNVEVEKKQFKTPRTKDNCRKQNGWKKVVDGDGNKFPNKKACLDYVENLIED